jgi:peptidoglycan hydrolase CwlO-like protein
MSEGIIVGMLSAAVSLIGIIVTSKSTRDQVTHKLDTNQQVTNTEIKHMKESIVEMKEDIKTHNHYAQLFDKNIPVVKEKIDAINQRIDDLHGKK